MLEAQQLGGAQIQSTQFMMQQGILKKTENPLDLAIQGEGFFPINLPDGRTALILEMASSTWMRTARSTSDGFRLAWPGRFKPRRGCAG
jgi:flagellar basal-body rod protein FlgG